MTALAGPGLIATGAFMIFRALPACGPSVGVSAQMRLAEMADTHAPAHRAIPFAAALRARLPLLFAVANLALLGWMLAGVRHANHDDIYFEIVANNPDLSWRDVAIWAAMLQQRTPHLFNIPIAMFGVQIGSFWFSEWIYQAQLLGTGVLAFFTLRRLVGEVAAAGWVSLTSGAFALHYYFTAPPSYPVIGLLSPGLFLISLYCLLIHIDRPSPICLTASAFASMIAVVWPEYGFIIFTIPIVGILVWKTSGTRRRRLLAIYACGWLVAALFYASGKLFYPPSADAARVTPSFDLVPLVKTFLTLWPKAILPFGLADGIHLTQQAVPGTPALPSLVTFQGVGELIFSDPSFLLMLLLWAAGFWLVLRRVSAHRNALWALFAMGAVLIIVPLAVVSLSSAYQRIVLAGYIQGHLASAAAQVGFTSVIFAACALGVQRWRSNLLCVPLAVLMAALCVLSLGYNLLMRDAMAANQQRWTAFHLAAQAIPAGARVIAPTFWGNNGVSAIPATLPFHMANYWTEWSRLMEAHPLDVRPAEEASADGDILAAYAPSPSGFPLVLLKDSSGLQLLSQMPRDLRGWASPNWDCKSFCRLRLPDTLNWADANKLLWPAHDGPEGLWGRLLLNRNGGFGSMP